jgi:pimeloyl-ACP methyl ester carboxylesterase
LVLLAYAANLAGSTIFSTAIVANELTSAQENEQAESWPYPGQESWIEEPVFNGRLHLVEAGRQNPQTIVLIHGLAYRGMLDWAEAFPELTDKYHVIAIDLPGFGSSDNHLAQYAPEKYSLLISWVVSQYAHGPVIVIGHSMGGAVSLRYTHNYPEQVSRLIMVDAAGMLQRTVFIKHLAKTPVTYKWLAPYQSNIPLVDKLIRKIAHKADGWTQSLLVTVDRMPDIPQLMMSNDIARKYLYKDRSTLNAALGLVYEDFSAAAREVDVPTHIIWGEHDDVASIRTGVVLANLMPNAELHIVHEAGHVPMTDNFNEFMTALKNSLVSAPHSKQAQNLLAQVEIEKIVNDISSCDGQNNVVYTGHYGVLRLRNCYGVVLRDLVAESVELISSEVLLENVKLTSSETGLSATDSVVIATLLQIEANIGMVVANSYLDLAGADFITHERLIDIHNSSKLYFSLSENRQDNQTYSLHGVSLGTVFKVQ